jgi:hypothetical protein
VDRALKPLLLVFAALQLVIGILLWATPGFFHDHIGPFGARNDHYMGDVATFYLALAAATFVAARRPSWRVPVLAVAVVQGSLHAINHLIDIGDADPGWLGPADFVSVLAGTALLAWMLSVAHREAPR